MIDIHSHILPGIDDGSDDWEMSLSMAKQACLSGTKYMFATPHYIHGRYASDRYVVTKLVQEFNFLLNNNNIPLQVHSGQEIFITKSMVEYMDDGDFLPLGGSDYYLVELPMLEIPDYASETLYEATLPGRRIILAHPERYQYVIKDTDVLLPFLQDNILLQMNSGSIIGVFGKKVQKTAIELLKRRMISFIGSDAHGEGSRNTSLKEAYDEVCSLVSKPYARDIFFNNANKALLKNQQLQPYRILPKKKPFWGKLF